MSKHTSRRSATVGTVSADLEGTCGYWFGHQSLDLFFERQPRYFPSIKAIFEHLKLPQFEGVTSVITLIEVCVQPQRSGNTGLVQLYEHALTNSQQIRMQAVTPKIAKLAVKIRATHNLRVPDAIQIAAELEANATLFITNDRQFSRVTDLQVLLIDDVIE